MEIRGDLHRILLPLSVLVWGRVLAVYGMVDTVESSSPTTASWMLPKEREVDLSLCAFITIIIGAMVPESSHTQR